MKLSPLHKIFLQDMLARGASPQTIRAYECDFDRLVAFVGNDVRGLTLAKLSEYPAWLANRPGARRPGATTHAVRTVARRLNSASSFCRWLVRRGDLPANPFDLLPRPKHPKRLPRPLAADAVRTILQLPDITVRDAALVALMRYEGLRVSEVAGLSVEQVDLSRNVVRVLGKGGKERVLPLVAPLRPYLDRHLAAIGRHEGPLFIGQEGRHLGRVAIGRILDRLAQKVGLPHFTAHRLRHTFATEAIRAGVKPPALQKWLGHESLDTTMLYVEVTTEDIAESARAIEAYSSSLLASPADVEAASPAK